MASYSVTPRQLGVLITRGHQARMEKITSAIRTTVRTAGLAIVQDVIQREIPRPVATAGYRRSWHAVNTPGGATLYNDAPHAIFVENGRKAGSKFPPLSVIVDWVILKGLVKGTARKTRHSASTNQLKEAARIAFVIARAIAKRGMRGHHIMEKTRDRLNPAVKDAIIAALEGRGE